MLEAIRIIQKGPRSAYDPQRARRYLYQNHSLNRLASSYLSVFAHIIQPIIPSTIRHDRRANESSTGRHQNTA